MKPLHCLPLITPLVLAGCATTYHAGAPKGAIQVIAHRGASAYAPENTLAAFERAIALHADWFELDCHLTKDGEVMVMHNGDVDKTTNGQGRIADMTLAELKALDAGSWFAPEFAEEPVPTLGEALDLAKERIGVYVEIKDAGDAGAVAGRLSHAAGEHTVLTRGLRRELMAAIEKSGTRNLELTRKTIAAIRERRMKDQVVIQSFSSVVCFIALCEAPELRTEFLGSDDKEKPQHWSQFLETGYLMDVAGFNVHHESLSEERLANFHRARKTAAVWTVDEEPLLRRYAQWGVDAIITNKPDVALEVLEKAGKR